MYSSQRHHHHLHHKSRQCVEIAQAATEIIELAREIVAHGHVERKFMVFPLFMAGVVSRSSGDLSERTEVLQLMRAMEQDSVGENVVAFRRLLEAVYERQQTMIGSAEQRSQKKSKRGVGYEMWFGADGDAEAIAAGYSDNGYQSSSSFPGSTLSFENELVDWVSLVEELGFQVVNCRL